MNQNYQNIIDAAMICFAKNGYTKTTTAAICQQANVSKGLLFHYFSNKKALYLFCIQAAIDDYVQIIDKIDVSNLSFTQTITTFSQIKIEYFLKHTTRYEVLVSATLTPDPEIKLEVDKLINNYIAASLKILELMMKKMQLKPKIDPSKVLQIILSLTTNLEKKYQKELLDPNVDVKITLERMTEEILELIDYLLYGVSYQE